MADIEVIDMTGSDSSPTKGESGSVYDALRAELATEVDVETVWLTVPGRPNIDVEFYPALEFDLLRAFMKKCIKPGSKGKEFDALKFAYQIMSFLCRGVRIGGKVVTTENGDPVTFVNMVPGKTTPEAIRWVYGNDGHILVLSQNLVELCGYSDEDMESDDGPLGI